MTMIFYLASFFLLVSTLVVQDATGHGLMSIPVTRNLHAFNAGLLNSRYEATALNNLITAGNPNIRSSSVCGQVQQGTRNFDTYRSGNQATYSAGQVITVRTELTVYHWGHFEFSLCPAGSTGAPSQDCFRNNKLRIVRDNTFGAPVDVNYPFRAMIPPESFGRSYSYQVQLPSNLARGNYVLKWMYVTANSCYAVGYDRYPFPTSWGSMYRNNLPICGTYDLAMPPSFPEVFNNCAEIAITGGTPPAPVATPPAPVASPTIRPPPATGSGLGDWALCSTSSQCANGCCSSAYSNGVLKCTPLTGGFSSGLCVSGSARGDWALCSTSSQCANGCCSSAYSNGVLKCTPLTGGFRSGLCVAGRRRGLRGGAGDEVEDAMSDMHTNANATATVNLNATNFVLSVGDN